MNVYFDDKNESIYRKYVCFSGHHQKTQNEEKTEQRTPGIVQLMVRYIT